MAPHAKTHKEPTFFRPWGAMGFPGGAGGKELICQCKRHKRHRFDTWVRMASHSSILAWTTHYVENPAVALTALLGNTSHQEQPVGDCQALPSSFKDFKRFLVTKDDSSEAQFSDTKPLLIIPASTTCSTFS